MGEEYCCGDKFFSQHFLDAAKLDYADRALLISTAGNVMTVSSIFPAFRRIGHLMRGAPGVPSGKGIFKGQRVLPGRLDHVSAPTTAQGAVGKVHAAAPPPAPHRQGRPWRPGMRRPHQAHVVDGDEYGYDDYDEQDEEEASLRMTPFGRRRVVVRSTPP